MKRREAVGALIAGTSIVLALLAVFAVDLTDNQARSRGNLERQAHQNAQLVAGLIDSLFSTASQPSPQLLAEYGMKHVRRRFVQRNRGSNEYVVLLNSRDRVLAASRGFTALGRADIAPGTES